MNTKTVLFLATNPIDAPELRLANETKIIENVLGQSDNRDNFEFVHKGAVTRGDLVRYLNKHKPDILHISGHGDEDGNIMFEGDDQYSQPLRIQGLARFLNHYTKNLQCLILNACYTANYLQNFETNVPIIIGMSEEIPDDSAILFSQTFYDSWFSGREIKESFEIGRDSLGFGDENELEIPVLIGNSEENTTVETETSSQNLEPERQENSLQKISIYDKINNDFDSFKDEFFTRIQRFKELGDIESILTELASSKKDRHYDAIDPNLQKEIDDISEKYSEIKNDLIKSSIPRKQYETELLKIYKEIDSFIEKLKSKIEEIEKKADESGSFSLPGQILPRLGHIYGEGFNQIKEVARGLLDKNNGINDINRRTAVTISLTTLILISGITFISNPEVKNATLFINLIVHLALIIYMIFYKIVPTIGVAQFEKIRKSDELLKQVFQANAAEMYKYYLRATSAIKQFSKWWKLLGISFLSLYLFYYISEMSKIYGYGEDFFTRYEHIADISLNGIEAFFLYIIYKLLTDKTLKENYNYENGFHYVNTVKFKRPLYVLFFILVAFSIIGYQVHGMEETNDSEVLRGVFHLITRSISGVLVAIGLCLVIGRLDSKFIAAKNYTLGLLYLYAALQAMFILFDKSIIEDLFGANIKINESGIASQFVLVKSVILYLMLILKAIFIFFVHSIYKKNFLFYYFLMGSRLNDNITSGKMGNEFVKFDGKTRRTTINVPATD